MTDIEELRKIVTLADANPDAAIRAMIQLARLYGDGADGVKPDQGKAFAWAEKAAYRDSPDGYLEISRIIGSACIGSQNPAEKVEYADYVVGVCDLATLHRFKRPDIAYNVGSVCEYMALCAAELRLSAEIGVNYIDNANLFYQAAVDIPDPYDFYQHAKAESKQGLERLQPTAPERKSFDLAKRFGWIIPAFASPAPQLRPC
jgi:hypothetical protein